MGIGQYQLLLNKGVHPYEIPALSLGKGIPKDIHQTYSSWDNLKPEWKENIEKMSRLNPDWIYHFYDDAAVEQFILNEYGEPILALYQRINPKIGPARADLFRYLLMYKKGGVYLDIKSTITQPLNATLLPEDQFILSHWSQMPNREKELSRFPLGEYIQWAIVCAPGHPFLKAVIDAVLGNLLVYNPWLHGIGKRAALRVTGPFAYTFAIDAVKDRFPHRYIRQMEDMGIHYSLYTLNKPDENVMAHEKNFPNHYSQNRELLITHHSFTHSLYKRMRK